MNELIQELAYQAEEYADTMVDGGSEFHPVFVRKFAELIVQECVNVLHDNELWNRHISHALKEHFGVE
jgi:hypothetical protein